VNAVAQIADKRTEFLAGPLTTANHLDQAVEYLELAIISYLDAARCGEFFGYKHSHIERIDLVKRATSRIRKDMISDSTKEQLQEELIFS